MRKFFLPFLLAFAAVLGFAQTSTPNIGLQVPATGSNNWYIPLNYNFNKLDQYLSGNLAVSAFKVTNNLTVGGSITANQFIGPSGTAFATATNATQYSPAYYCGVGSSSAFCGIAPFTGLAKYLTSGPPVAAAASDIQTLLVNLTNCNDPTKAYNPQTNTCIASGSAPGGIAGNIQFNNGTLGGSAANVNAAGDMFPRSIYGSLQTEFYRTGGTGNNGIINALQSAQCPTTGCDVFVPGTSNSTEILGDFYQMMGLIPNNTTQRDYRSGAKFSLFNTNGVYIAGTTTRCATPNFAFPDCHAFFVRNFDIAGGYNYYGTAYGFKSNYDTGAFEHYYATAGQHNPNGGTINCFAWGDCVNGGLQMWVGGSAREPSDEKGHLGWLKIFELPGAPVTTVTVGGTGTSNITVANVNQGFGEERRLEDWKTYFDSTTPNCYISGGQSQGKPLAYVTLAKYSGTGTCLPAVDDAFMLATTAFLDTPTSHGAGLVTVTLQTTGFPTSDKPITWTTTTTGLPSTGLACVADYTTGQALPDRMEQVIYTVVNAGQLSMTLLRPHVVQPVIIIGPNCNRDFIAKANVNGTVAGIAAYGTVAQSVAIAGCQNNVCWLGNYAHTVDVYDSGGQSDGNSLVSYYQFNVASLSCASGTVTGTVTAASGNLDGVTFTLAGNDASFNGSFKVTATSAVDASNHAIFSYTDASCVNGSSTALGTLTYDSRGYVIVPAAQILHIYNTATGHVDGGISLYPNNVTWTASDTVVSPNDPSPDPSGQAIYVARTQPNVNYTSQNDNGALKVAVQGNPGNALIPLTVEVDVNDITQYYGFGGQRSLPARAAILYGGNYGEALTIDPGTTAAIHYRLNYWAKNKGVCDTRSQTAAGLFDYNTIGQFDSLVYDPCARQLKFTSNQAFYGFSQTGWQIGGNPPQAGSHPQLYGDTLSSTHFGTNTTVRFDSGVGVKWTAGVTSKTDGGSILLDGNDNGQYLGYFAAHSIIATGTLGTLIPPPLTSGANTAILDYFNGARLFSIGPNASTAGDFTVLGISSDGSVSNTYISCSHTGSIQCTFANPIIGSVTGNASSVGGITVSGTPSAGQILTALTSSTANWQAPAVQSASTKGLATLVAGTVTVSTSAAVAISTGAYTLTHCAVGGTIGTLSIGTVTVGTSFVINSASNTDTSQVCWQIMH